MDNWKNVPVWRKPRGRGRSIVGMPNELVFMDPKGRRFLDCEEASTSCQKSLLLPDVLDKVDLEQMTDDDLKQIEVAESTSTGSFMESAFHHQHGCLGCGLFDHQLRDRKCPKDLKMNWEQKVKFKEMTMSKGDHDDLIQRKKEKTRKWRETMMSNGWTWCKIKNAFIKTINGVVVVK